MQLNNNQTIIHLLKRLWPYVRARRRKQFGMLLILMLISSFAEIISIGSVLPFLGALTSPAGVFEHPLAGFFIQAFKFTEPEQLQLLFTIIFVLLAIIAGSMRLLLLWVSTRLSHSMGGELSVMVYRITLHQPYSVHCARNSSEIINGITHKSKYLIVLINMTLTLISGSVMLLAITGTLLSLNPHITALVFGGFGLCYILITIAFRKNLQINSQHIAKESSNVIKSLQEGLGGIRDILINGSQEVYSNAYNSSDAILRNAMRSNAFINSSPRFLMEALGMILIAGLSYKLSLQTDGFITAIPILGALALAAQRLLPVLQQVYSAWSAIMASQSSLQDTLDLLDQSPPDYANRLPMQPIPFNNTISLKQLNFRYSNQLPLVLKKINLTITKGSRVGFIGTTGSGKSTLLDIIMGLLEPTDGTLEIDGRSVTPKNKLAWQARIAHVPQSIFLADRTIAENIAFGVPKEKIDFQRIHQVAQQAQIAESIEKLPKQYATFVGERGVRLSGGQTQRIAIARALYNKADIIVFDEATSALDNETEASVMEAIESLDQDLTLLIIAHRLSTLSSCTQVVELLDGKIKQISSYDEMIDGKRQ